MNSNLMRDRILILDFGSQYTQLIARRVRELGVYCEVHPYHWSQEKIKDFNPAGIILSGGPESVNEASTPRAPQIIFKLGCPILGICYGMQTMAEQLGGAVRQGVHREFGYAEVKVSQPGKLFADIYDRMHVNEGVLDVWMSHGDYVAALPTGFLTVAYTAQCATVAMADHERHFYGVQFHPEVSHTKQGKQLLARFVLDICQCQPTWTAKNFIPEAIAEIRQKVGKDQVILGLSGGVDSAVAAALLHQAIGQQLICIFVDTGLLRRNETATVQQVFAKHVGIKLITVDASARFYQALAGITDPETKRKIIGKLFIEVFEEQAAQFPNAKWLAQGTIYSDVIESAGDSTKAAHKIKSHHNVGGLPEKMQLKLLEPLRELFKDEVRKLGLALQLPESLIYRHPFPGPGLAVRIIGDVTPEYADILRAADHIFMEELHQANLYQEISQAFAVFLPVKSVAVLGDARHYGFIIALRAVVSDDFMTAHCARIAYDVLETIARRISNEVPAVSRVVYDISSKPPATIEWE